jgi:sugar/nucleoside kinase (ribokinase family)
VGPLNVDLFLRGSLPTEREALNSWVGPTDVSLTVAGSVGYTVGVLARLGCEVELHSTLGSDPFAEFIRHELEQRGVDIEFLERAAGETAIGIYLLLFGGAKRPLTYRLPGHRPWPDAPAVARDDGPLPALVHSGGLLHFPSMWGRGLADSFARARARGCLTSIDPQFPLTNTPAPWLTPIADVVAEAQVLLCDEREARMLFDVPQPEAAIGPAHTAGPRIVAIKRGAQGALVSDGELVLEQPAVEVPEEAARESVGAGDAFDAGFLDALVRGSGLEDAARFATAAAALSLSGRGGADGVADHASVEAMLPRVPLARRV